MDRVAFVLSLTVAGGLHAALLGSWSVAPEVPSGAVGTEIRAHAGSSAVAALVAEWERAPEAVQEVAALEESLAVPEPVDMPGARDGRLGQGAPDRLTSLEAPDAAPEAEAAAPTRDAAPAQAARPTAPTNADARPEAVPAMMPVATPEAPPAEVSRPPEAAALLVTTRPPARPDRRTASAARPQKNIPARAQAETQSAASASAARAAQAAWARAIHQRIARHQTYPRRARGEGDVRLTITVLKDGRVTDVRVASSSGVAAFDKAAVTAVKRAAPFPAAPEELTEAYYAVSQRLLFRKRASP